VYILAIFYTVFKYNLSRELASTFAQLCHQVDAAKGDLQEDLKKLKLELEELESVATKANFFR